VCKILRGVKPADLPVEQPAKVEIIIGGKTAKAFGLAIAQSFLVFSYKVDRVMTRTNAFPTVRP
jgi:ABC-type uncharacterized transport system substrate-binding protein